MTPTESYRYHWPDITMSREHLRVHCILYEQDPIANIAPFVYATDLSANGIYLKKSNSEYADSQGSGILMGRNSTFLLDHGDELRLSESVTLTYYSDKPVQETHLTSIQEREKSLFASRYLITGRLLGEGGYGKVLIGIHQETQRQLACKIIRLDHLFACSPTNSLRQPTDSSKQEVSGTRKRWPTRVTNTFREFDILKDLSHPNIATIQKVFWSQNTIYMFQELVTGGDLFSFLEYKGGRIDSVCASVIIRQLLIGIKYLHDQDIVHRDLKPDNILMTSLEDGARVVITDFGSARFLPSESNPHGSTTTKLQRMFSLAGTLEFAAPEIYRVNPTVPAEQGYSKGVDMWSVGTITAAILSGETIFSANRAHPDYRIKSHEVIVGLSAQCDLSILDDEYHSVWSSIRDCPKDFIKRLLVLDENLRMTVSQALAHPWFSKEIYAADFENLYARCIKDWHPRTKDDRLVEAISSRLPSLACARISSRNLDQETTSRFFPQTEPNLKHDIRHSLSPSQYWRANTPLPSVRGEYEKTQFASQVVSPSHEASDDDTYEQSQQYQDSSGRVQCEQQTHDHFFQDEQQYHNAFTTDHQQFFDSCKRQNSVEDSISQLSFNITQVSGKCSFAQASEQDGSYGSGESLNSAMNQTFTQDDYYIHLSPPPASYVVKFPCPESKFPRVDGEEREEYCVHLDQLTDESYQQTQFAEEFQRAHTPVREQELVVVYETPIRTNKKHARSPQAASYDRDQEQWFGQESEVDQTSMELAIQEHRKRRKLTHCGH